MLRTPPTRIDLKSEDMKEYEEIKKTWPKPAQTFGKSPSVQQENPADAARKARNARLGYREK